MVAKPRGCKYFFPNFNNDLIAKYVEKHVTTPIFNMKRCVMVRDLRKFVNKNIFSLNYNHIVAYKELQKDKTDQTSTIAKQNHKIMF